MARRWLLSSILLVSLRFAVFGATPLLPSPVLLAVMSGWELAGGSAGAARHWQRGARHATRDLCRAERHLYWTVHHVALRGDLLG